MNTFGENIKITTWGESHGKAVGVVIDGVEPGLEISEADIQSDLDRRKPGTNKFVSSRKEDDKIEILSGIFEGKTTGAPISLIVNNHNSKSSDYESLKKVFRPGHADYTYHLKYKGYNDYRGGGRSSGRETVGRVAAGAIAKKILDKKGVKVVGFVKKIGNIEVKTKKLDFINKNHLFCPDPIILKIWEDLLLKIKSEKDSIGGIVELIITGCPAGIGNPVFDKLDAKISYALMSIGSVKGVEIGDGFKVAELKGSENNDTLNKNGFLTNHSGGILGGISTGQNIIIRLAVKPTPSIARSQQSITKENEETQINVYGRHDPCICPRIVPVAEAMTALVLVDYFDF